VYQSCHLVYRTFIDGTLPCTCKYLGKSACHFLTSESASNILHQMRFSYCLLLYCTRVCDSDVVSIPPVPSQKKRSVFRLWPGGYFAGILSFRHHRSRGIFVTLDGMVSHTITVDQLGRGGGVALLKGIILTWKGVVGSVAEPAPQETRTFSNGPDCQLYASAPAPILMNDLYRY
jgi:hypothetical protein